MREPQHPQQHPELASLTQANGSRLHSLRKDNYPLTRLRNLFGPPRLAHLAHGTLGIAQDPTRRCHTRQDDDLYDSLAEQYGAWNCIHWIFPLKSGIQFGHLASYHNPNDWPNRWKSPLDDKDRETYALYDRPEASWRNIKLLRYPADLVVEIEVGQTLAMGYDKYPYILFLPAGTANLGQLIHAFTRVVKKGGDGNMEWSRQQGTTTYGLQGLHAEESGPGGRLIRSVLPRLSFWVEYPPREETRRWMQGLQETHDMLIQGAGGCGRELGECRACTMEWKCSAYFAEMRCRRCGRLSQGTLPRNIQQTTDGNHTHRRQ